MQVVSKKSYKTLSLPAKSTKFKTISSSEDAEKTNKFIDMF